MVSFLLLASLTLPSANAGLVGEVVLVCDIALAPTKCASAAADTISTCAQADFTGPLGGAYSGEFCVDVVGAAAATAIVHIPAGIHNNVAKADQTDTCIRTYTNLLGSSGCGASEIADGCGVGASAEAIATNVGSITTGDVSTKAVECPAPPPPDPPEPSWCWRDPPSEVCVGNQDPNPQCLLFRAEQDPPRCIGLTTGSTVIQPLGELPADVQEKIKAQVAAAFQEKLREGSAKWPSGELPDMLREIMHEEYAKAAEEISPMTLVRIYPGAA